MSDIFDFGFTAVDESELESVQKAQAEVNTTSADAQLAEEKLNKLYNAILPLMPPPCRRLPQLLHVWSQQRHLQPWPCHP